MKSRIKDLLGSGDTVCLWFSGGADSRLLLEVMLETGKPFSILTFEDGWNDVQRRQLDQLVIEKHVQVFTYPALGHLLCGEGPELALVSSYAVDAAGSPALLGRDLVEDEARCFLDIEFGSVMVGRNPAPMVFDVHVWGSRSSDRHWLMPDGLIAAEEWMVGSRRIMAPLAGWTERHVTQALKRYKAAPFAINTGDIHACHRCLQGSGSVLCPKTNELISSAQWDRGGNTQQVRELLRGQL